MFQCAFKNWEKILLQVLIIAEFFDLLDGSWCFFGLLSFFLLNSRDFSHTMALKSLHLLDEIINILEIVKKTHFHHKTTLVCHFFIETAVDMSIA